MPASKRRSSGVPTSKAKKPQQSTLAFHGAKVSKPNATPTGKDAKKNSKEKAITLLKQTAETAKPSDIEDAPITADVAIVEQVVADAKAPVLPEEEEALAVSEAQIKKYWREKEKLRMAPRVHQKDLGLEEKVCREFDTDSRFGPCVGMARIKRWKRAQMLGLKPPIEILAVLLREQEAGNVKAQRARIDELLNNSTGEVQ